MIAPLVQRVRTFTRSGRTRPVWLGASLLLTLGVSTALAYEAWRSGEAQQRSAERALREYARFAASNYRQRVQARMFTAIAGVIRPIANPRAAGDAGALPDVAELRERAEAAVRCNCGPALAPSIYFRVMFDGRGVSVAGGTASASELAMLAGLPDSIGPDLAASNGWEYATAFDVSGSAPRILVISLRRGVDLRPLAVYGFGVPISAFNEQIIRLSPAPSLLQFTPAESVPNDSVLSVSLAGPTGARFTATTRRYASPYIASVAFRGVAGVTGIDVALNPRVAPGLLIGAVPTSRLPLLVALLGLCGLLLSVTVVLAARAMELARMRSDFVANVSHELRTPLAQVLLFGETLSLGRMTTRREVRRAAEIIVGETRRLMQLVDNVLLFGRRERGAAAKQLETVAIVPIVRDVIAAFAPLAAAADVKVEAVRLEEVTVAADRAEVRQLLLNLLDNAVKYGPRGQRVTVGVTRVSPSRGDSVRLWVEDEGPGIPADDRERVWQPFVRLTRDIESETAGSGIGLAVARQIVERHGGAAWVESAPSGGACIVIELPCAAAPLTTDTALTARRALRESGSGL